MLLLGLVLGALLGAAVTLLVLRERLRSALTQNRAGEDSADRLLRLADERHERDVARRDAAEEEREAELQRTADRVYRMIEDRIRRERRRLGL